MQALRTLVSNILFLVCAAYNKYLEQVLNYSLLFRLKPDRCCAVGNTENRTWIRIDQASKGAGADKGERDRHRSESGFEPGSETCG